MAVEAMCAYSSNSAEINLSFRGPEGHRGTQVLKDTRPEKYSEQGPQTSTKACETSS